MRTIAGWTGRVTLRSLENIGSFSLLLFRVLRSALVDPVRGRGGVRWRASVIQMLLVGYNAIPVVGLVSLFMGIVLALQSAYQLEKFGITIFVVDLVAVGMTREIGPLLTAVVVAGRSGSAIAAEIGSMKVAEEIDALRAMGLNPIRFLAVPKFVALAVMLPCLTLVSDIMGMVGGSLIGAGILDITFGRFAERAAEALVLRDVVTGLVKSLVFAGVVSQVGCYYGFSVRGGAAEVGSATTRAVVTSIFLTLAADVVFTAIFYAL